MEPKRTPDLGGGAANHQRIALLRKTLHRQISVALISRCWCSSLRRQSSEVVIADDPDKFRAHDQSAL